MKAKMRPLPVPDADINTEISCFVRSAGVRLSGISRIPGYTRTLQGIFREVTGRGFLVATLLELTLYLPASLVLSGAFFKNGVFMKRKKKDLNGFQRYCMDLPLI
jgi:hypothetical protein